MIALLLLGLVGFTVGYLIVGPANRSYTPLQYAKVIMTLGSAYSVGVILALTLASILTGPASTSSVAGVAIAYGGILGYTLTISLGAYVQQKRKDKPHG